MRPAGTFFIIQLSNSRELMEEDEDNEARYYYAFGRIAKKKTEYKKAIELFEIAILKRKRYLSPYRELAECYIPIFDSCMKRKSL